MAEISVTCDFCKQVFVFPKDGKQVVLVSKPDNKLPTELGWRCNACKEAKKVLTPENQKIFIDTENYVPEKSEIEFAKASVADYNTEAYFKEKAAEMHNW
jgi:hypothetical protein